LAKRLAGPSGAGPAAEALTACRLWDVRQGSIGSLRQERQAACALLPCLLSRAGLMVIDGLLDRLDPWTRNDVLGLIETKLGAGASLALSTNDLGLAESCDDLIVLRGDSIAYFGPLKALLAEFGPDILEVETDNRPGVKALVDPVVAEVEECETGLRLKVRDGMETAVRLLLQGYGDVKIVAVRRPRLKDVLMERFGV
jgi:ABC-type multidrug transport system ATPase subunit